ncbi:unnamed protein product, partial [Symbiodinium pilosum]
MFSAHFEEALLSASDEELRNFFAELPLAARRRLIAVLAEVDAASAQHFLDTNRLDDDADLADLQWPSDPEQPSVRQPSPAPSESSSDVSLASWGMTSVQLLSRLSGPCLFRAQLSWDQRCLQAPAGLVRLAPPPDLPTGTLPAVPALLAVLIASAFVWDLSVTIRSVQTPVRVWTILPGAVGTGTTPAMPATSG